MKKAAVPSILVVVVLLALAVTAEAQQAKKVSRIGYLAVNSPSVERNLVEAFQQGLRTNTIGIMVVAFLAARPVGDPVATGLVASLARPGGNITGLSNMQVGLSGKRLELLKEMVPKVSRVFVLWNPGNPFSELALRETEAAGRALRIQLQPLEVRSPKDLEPAFSEMSAARAAALLVMADSMFRGERARLADLAVKNRLPTVLPQGVYVEAGGLMSYGENQADLWRRSATYVDKILKGTKPADLPVEQPTKFEFIINLKAAKQIGVTIPPNVLVRADKVIK